MQNEVGLHNHQLAEQILNPEEGIDNFELPPNLFDPNKVNVKKLEREIRNELKEMHIDKPLQAEQHAKFLCSKNTVVDWALA